MFHALRPGLAALAAGALLALPGSAAADTVVTLTGETLNATPAASTATIDCAPSPSGSSTVTYDVTGTALGPYPGTFHETGTVTYHEGAVESLSAHFTILSNGTTITGDKQPILSEQPLISACAPQTGFAQVAQVLLFEHYDATVSGPLGSFSESGRATTNLRAAESTNGETTLTMQQSFESGGPPGTTVELAPLTSINPTGTMHTVTATVRDAAAQPVEGVTVLIAVISPTGGTSRCVTDSTGSCTYTYQGPDSPQADDITACADTNVNGQTDVGEPCADASKVWTKAASTPGQVTGGGYIREFRVSFGLHAKAATITDPPDGGCNVNDHIDGVRIQCLTVTTVVLSPTHATLLGEAEQDGIATNYRIDVDDLSDLGQPDTFQIQTDLGYVNGGTLTGGNIHINP